MKNKKEISIFSINYSTVLIVFLVLKLTNVINWSWWIVLSPLWVGIAILVVALVILALAAIAIFLIEKIEDHFED